MRRSAALLSVFMGVFASQVTVAAAITRGSTVEVVAKEANVMVGEKILATVKRGDKLKALSQKGKWVGVSMLKDGKKVAGWILAKQVAPSSAAVRPPRKPEPHTQPVVPHTKPDPGETPKKLTFDPARRRIAAGDKWVYAVRSADAALDGKTVTFTCIAADAKTARFKAKFDSSAEREFTLGRDASTFIIPCGVTPKAFEATGIITTNEAVTIEKDYRWRQQSVAYLRPGDPSSAAGHLVVAVGPEKCRVPAGTFLCAAVQKHRIAGGQVRKHVATSWHTRRSPFAVRARVPQAKTTALLYVELLSYPGSAESGRPAGPEIPRDERAKLLQWVRANCVNDSLRDHLVALFHVAVADHADKTVEWALGSALTTNGKGVVLTMKNGKFSVAREIPAGEEAADARRQFTERILAR